MNSSKDYLIKFVDNVFPNFRKNRRKEDFQRTMSIPISFFFFFSILTFRESTPSFQLQLISNSSARLPRFPLSLSILRYALTLDDFND